MPFCHRRQAANRSLSVAVGARSGLGRCSGGGLGAGREGKVDALGAGVAVGTPASAFDEPADGKCWLDSSGRIGLTSSASAFDEPAGGKRLRSSGRIGLTSSIGVGGST